jgi:hypothetical protein
MTNKYKTISLRILTALMIISLPLLGSDCEDVINQINQNPCSNNNDITGEWTLIYNAGTLLDICPGEVVNFPGNSGGTATLTCPEQNPIQRLYTVTGTTLEYTETGMEYEVGFTENCELVLSGINNNRILYYSSTVSDNKQSVVSDNKISINNSSEIK